MKPKDKAIVISALIAYAEIHSGTEFENEILELGKELKSQGPEINREKLLSHLQTDIDNVKDDPNVSLYRTVKADVAGQYQNWILQGRFNA